VNLEIAHALIAYRRLDVPAVRGTTGEALFVYQNMFNTELARGLNHAAATKDEVYYYEHAEDAIAACFTWDGVGDAPGPWIRHLPSNRRRPGGDASKEEVRP